MSCLPFNHFTSLLPLSLCLSRSFACSLGVNAKTKSFSYIRLSFLRFFILVVVYSHVWWKWCDVNVIEWKMGWFECCCFFLYSYALHMQWKARIKALISSIAHQLSYIFHQFLNDSLFSRFIRFEPAVFFSLSLFICLCSVSKSTMCFALFSMTDAKIEGKSAFGTNLIECQRFYYVVYFFCFFIGLSLSSVCLMVGCCSISHLNPWNCNNCQIRGIVHLTHSWPFDKQNYEQMLFLIMLKVKI